MRTRKCCIKTLVPVRPPTLAHVKVRAHTHAGQAHAHRRSWALARRCLLALRLDVDARAAQKCLRTGAVASHAVAQRSAGNLAAEGQFGRPSPSSMHTPSPARVRTHRRACTRACLPVIPGQGRRAAGTLRGSSTPCTHRHTQHAGRTSPTRTSAARRWRPVCSHVRVPSTAVPTTCAHTTSQRAGGGTARQTPRQTPADLGPQAAAAARGVDLRKGAVHPGAGVPSRCPKQVATR